MISKARVNNANFLAKPQHSIQITSVIDVHEITYKDNLHIKSFIPSTSWLKNYTTLNCGLMGCCNCITDTSQTPSYFPYNGVVQLFVGHLLGLWPISHFATTRYWIFTNLDKLEYIQGLHKPHQMLKKLHWHLCFMVHLSAGTGTKRHKTFQTTGTRVR